MTPTRNWKLVGVFVVTRIGGCTFRDRFANADRFLESVTSTVSG